MTLYKGLNKITILQQIESDDIVIFLCYMFGLSTIAMSGSLSLSAPMSGMRTSWTGTCG